MIFYSYQLRVYAGKRERINRRGKIRLISSGYEKGRKGRRKMRYYEFIPDFRVRYKSLFGLEYSILKHLFWASITVLSVSFPARRWALMKIYCTFHRGLHVAFSDDWIENRSLAIGTRDLNRQDDTSYRLLVLPLIPLWIRESLATEATI